MGWTLPPCCAECSTWTAARSLAIHMEAARPQRLLPRSLRFDVRWRSTRGGALSPAFLVCVLLLPSRGKRNPTQGSMGRACRYALPEDSAALCGWRTRAPLLVLGSHDWNIPNERGELACGGDAQRAVLSAARLRCACSRASPPWPAAAVLFQHAGCGPCGCTCALAIGKPTRRFAILAACCHVQVLPRADNWRWCDAAGHRWLLAQHVCR